ncbi:unnamed protein product [Fraxinus pennsylvanica]|uniref:Glycosyl transferase 48 domain-containing protein n=1 Tax=Fraxinus pennsylvanica TaxID=56036 RepID=A0AAD2DKC6_9LAMI|nr:unnamed protein product [Fraxinus pennsylvanica]
MKKYGGGGGHNGKRQKNQGLSNFFDEEPQVDNDDKEEECCSPISRLIHLLELYLTLSLLFQLVVFTDLLLEGLVAVAVGAQERITGLAAVLVCLMSYGYTTHMLRLANFKWDILWLPFGPLSALGWLERRTSKRMLSRVVACVMVMEIGIERGFVSAIGDFIIMHQQLLASVFFTFQLGTKAHYYERTILHGGSKYRGTGWGFVVCHAKFSENYRLALGVILGVSSKRHHLILLTYFACSEFYSDVGLMSLYTTGGVRGQMKIWYGFSAHVQDSERTVVPWFFLSVMIVLFMVAGLVLTDIFAAIIAFMPTGWALILHLDCLKKAKIWDSMMESSRAFGCRMGLLIFIPIVVLSCFLVVSKFQTRLLFNQAFSWGLQISMILAGIKNKNA